MKTTYSFISFVLICLLSTLSASAQNTHSSDNWILEIQSMERPLESNDTAKVIFKIRFLDTTAWHYSLNLNRQLYFYDYEQQGDSNYAASDW
jgi:hypothetical protein